MALDCGSVGALAAIVFKLMAAALVVASSDSRVVGVCEQISAALATDFMSVNFPVTALPAGVTALCACGTSIWWLQVLLLSAEEDLPIEHPRRPCSDEF